MHDGRAFTDYRPSCDVNNLLMHKYSVLSNHEYRLFLQKNGDSVRADSLTETTRDGCKECPVCKKV